MNNYFTEEHFALMNKWKGQKFDKTNSDQNDAYEELKNAYEVTETWARQVQQKLFPQGYIEVRKRPTNRANNFTDYHWAKIYPTYDAPKQLAYTVSISAADRFEISIDTVGLGEENSTRLAYRKMRGPDDSSAPFIARLDKKVALGKSMAELVNWTIDSIKGFRLGYEEVADE